MEKWGLYAFFVCIVRAKLDQTSARDMEVKVMMKPAFEWVRTSDPVIRNTAN